MASNRMSPNQREILSAQSTITGKQEYLTSTGGILNTNASVSITGSAIPASGLTTAVAVQIVDGSGNQITSFGGGTQYTDGGVPPTHPIGNTIEWSDGSNWQTVSTAKPLPVSATFSPSGTQDTNLKQINGNTTLVGNGVTGTGSQRVTIASDNTAFSVNATLSAETTKVIGVTRTADGSGNLLTSTANALDINIKSGNPTSIAVTQTTNPWIVAGGGTAGTAATGVVTIQGIASMTKLLVTPDANSAVNVAQINGITPLMGNGITGTGSQRVTIASDNTPFATKIDQTTLGSTNNVSISGSSGAGTSNLIKDITQFGDGVTSGILDVGLSLYNGTNYDRLKGDATNGAFVQLKTAIPAGTNAIGSVNLAPIATGGWSGYPLGTASNAALTTTQTVSAAAGKVAGYALINLNSSPAYIQVFDTTGAVTLGTTAPNYIFVLPANSTAANGLAANLEITVGLTIANGIKIAATTTSNGASTVATGVTGTVFYK